MPHYKAPIRDFQFILNDYLNIGQFRELSGFGDSGPELMNPLLEAAAQMCEEVLFPLNQKGDKIGLKYDDGRVIMPDGFKEAYKLYVEGGWPAFTCDLNYGGQGLPEVLNMPLMEMVCSSNLALGMTPGLSHGAYNAILLHASDDLKKTFLPKIVTGEWSGVMCLTEPQAGTDLGLVRTAAKPNADGSFAISGTKIFISSGEHELTENIIHLVLARLPDAPSGIKGISLFLVPKFMVDSSGVVGKRNAVRCEGIEHKMGLHASPTCVMNYDNAVGYLVGAPNKGMKAMFRMHCPTPKNACKAARSQALRCPINRRIRLLCMLMCAACCLPCRHLPKVRGRLPWKWHSRLILPTVIPMRWCVRRRMISSSC